MITNDGATILRELHITHPGAKLLRDVAFTQEQESMVFLSSKLLSLRSW